MAVYRQVHTTFWQDPEMLEYDPEEKYFYLYLMTNPHTTQCGIYEISKKLMSVELGYSIDTVSILLDKFIDMDKILYSEETKEIFLINWLKYNSLKSPKVMSCVEKELKTVKNKDFLRLFRDICIQYEYPIDTISIDYGEEKEKEKEKEKEYIKSDSKNPTSPASISAEDEKPKNKTDHAKDIFNHWNNKNIIVHRNMTDKIKRAITGALKDYKPEEICKSIDNYSTILSNSDKYFWSYRWGIREFVLRGIDKFLDFEIAASNYARDNRDNKARDDPKGKGPAGPQKNFNNRDINSYDFDKFFTNLEVNKDE